MSIAKIIGERLRAYRIQKGWSQEMLAEKAELHHTYIGQLERGEKNATIESIYKVTTALDIPLSALFENISPSSEVRDYASLSYNGFIENLVVFYLENSGHKITLYTKRWFALANHFFLCYNIFRYFSIFGGFLLALNQYLL